MRNAFGLEIYEIKELLRDTKVEEFIYKNFSHIFKHLGIRGENSDKILNRCLDHGKNYSHVFDYESEVHKIFESEGIAQQINKKLAERSKIMYNQIKPYIVKGSILDLGCGDGEVGGMFAEDHKVFLSDVYEHPNIKNTGLEFRLCCQGKDLPFDSDSFNNVFLLTVLHHSDYPIKTVRETHRVTKPGGRALIIESVYGVTGEELSGKELPSSEMKRAEEFLSLNPEQQRMSTFFFDHLHNRIINYREDPREKVNLPANFNTPDGWKKIFEENGLHQMEIIHLGFDQPTAYEYHTLHICES